MDAALKNTSLLFLRHSFFVGVRVGVHVWSGQVRESEEHCFTLSHMTLYAHAVAVSTKQACYKGRRG